MINDLKLRSLQVTKCRESFFLWEKEKTNFSIKVIGFELNRLQKFDEDLICLSKLEKYHGPNKIP